MPYFHVKPKSYPLLHVYTLDGGLLRSPRYLDRHALFHACRSRYRDYVVNLPLGYTQEEEDMILSAMKIRHINFLMKNLESQGIARRRGGEE